MSLAEMKEAIDKLSGEDQFRLREYLQEKMSDNEEWRAEMSRRMDEMDKGNTVTSAQLEARHRELESQAAKAPAKIARDARFRSFCSTGS